MSNGSASGPRAVAAVLHDQHQLPGGRVAAGKRDLTRGNRRPRAQQRLALESGSSGCFIDVDFRHDAAGVANGGVNAQAATEGPARQPGSRKTNSFGAWTPKPQRKWLPPLRSSPPATLRSTCHFQLLPRAPRCATLSGGNSDSGTTVAGARHNMRDGGPGDRNRRAAPGRLHEACRGGRFRFPAKCLDPGRRGRENHALSRLQADDARVGVAIDLGKLTIIGLPGVDRLACTTSARSR